MRPAWPRLRPPRSSAHRRRRNRSRPREREWLDRSGRAFPLASALRLPSVPVARTRRALWHRPVLYMSGADALITVWNDKGNDPFWRPITAIREAGSDGNPWTKADPDWLPLRPGSAVSGALFGAQRTELRLRSRRCRNSSAATGSGGTGSNNGGLTRSCARFSHAIDEVVDARVWSGILFRNADGQGAEIGRRSRSHGNGTTSSRFVATTTDGERAGRASRPARPWPPG